ncbi:hypothetical protein GCM10010278_73710 [Streptomyces melanogenes]|nr:hypothetical protein GCM10010278_73710 [Streptomyces melanogenes]
MSLLTSSAGVGGITPDDYGPLIVQPVERESVALQVATQLTTTSTTVRIPVVQTDAGASYVAEGAEIAPSDAALGELVITPPKLAGLSIVSSELSEDSNPAAQQMIGNGLARSIARALDSAFFNALPAPAPPGLEAVSGVGTVKAGATINNADAFLTAISQAEEQGATLTAFVAHPSDALALGKLKQGKDSNVPLLGNDPTLPTRRTILGVPLHVCSAVKPGTIWGLPKDRVMVVMRRDVRVDVSTDAKFTSDQVAVKATMRAAGAFPHPAAIQKITVGAA